MRILMLEDYRLEQSSVLTVTLKKDTTPDVAAAEAKALIDKGLAAYIGNEDGGDLSAKQKKTLGRVADEIELQKAIDQAAAEEEADESADDGADAFASLSDKDLLELAASEGIERKISSKNRARDRAALIKALQEKLGQEAH